MSYYLDALKKYATFTGRTSRKSFWWFTIISFILGIILYIIDIKMGNVIGMSHTTIHEGSQAFGRGVRPHIGVLSGIYGLIIFIPSLSILIRRLHDISRSGWWILLGIIPFIGQLILFIFTLLRGSDDNIYGSAIVKPYS